MTLFNPFPGPRGFPTNRQSGSPFSGHALISDLVARQTRTTGNRPILGGQIPGGPLAAAAARLGGGNDVNNRNAGAAFDWRNQMRRLAAALHDANPASPGRGALTAYDDQREARNREDQELTRSRHELEQFADRMGLPPEERILLLQNPAMWFQLFGVVRRQRMGAPSAPVDDGDEL